MPVRVQTFVLDELAVDPDPPADGQMWLSGGRTKVREGGVTKTVVDGVYNLDGGEADTNYGGIGSVIDGGSA